jgi:tetratricopeptide (TPR) repeat protein
MIGGSRARLAVIIAALLLAACAPKKAPVPPTVTVPKYPDYLYPLPPAGIGTPAAVERHYAGWQYLQAGDLRAAERNFNSALKQSAAFYPAEVGLGYAAMAGKKYKEALLHFDRAVVANPRYAPALAGRAEALLATGQTDQAIQSIEAALSAAPNEPALAPLRTRLEVLRFREQQTDISTARKLAESGRLEEARAAYEGAIEASPGSPFLLRELADVERRAGNAAAAMTHAERARDLDPDDPRNHLLLGDLLEAQGQYARAADELSAAAALQPDDALTRRIESLRSRAAFEAMPEEYRGIESAPSITRAQLAALLAVRLENLLSQSRRVNAVVITDTRGSWAAQYILTVARAGVMEVYPNHTFQPSSIVRRGDLALAASRVLELIASRTPRLAAAWRDARRKFPDVGPRHLSYPAVSLAVEAGVMSTLEDGSFGLARPVTGQEAVAAVTKLQDLATPQRR